LVLIRPPAIRTQEQKTRMNIRGFGTRPGSGIVRRRPGHPKFGDGDVLLVN
jgi:hypothetical protein